MAGVGSIDHQAWAEAYGRAMSHGEQQYADVTAAITARFNAPAEFTQTGGMCGALHVALEAGHYLLLTDEEDTLPFDRAEHVGWCVGLYDSSTDDTVGLRWLMSRDGSVEAALELIDRLLKGEGS